MQKPLALKTYEIPEGIAPQAQELCETLVQDLEKTHAFYKQQIAFLKQQYLIALRSLRPNMVSVVNLRELFDESEMTVDPAVSTEIDDPEDNPRNKKKKKKKKSAIPEDAPRTIVEHDVPESQRTCSEDGSQLSPMGFDVKLELKYKPATLEVIEHRFPKYGCSLCKGTVVRQPPEPSLIPQSYASSELLAHIAVAKFCDHRVPRTYQPGRRYGADKEMRDWPLAAGDQDQAANPCMLLPLRAVVVSDADKAEKYSVSVRLEETSESKLSMKRRNSIVDVKTGSGGRPGTSVSGVLKTGSRDIRLEGSVNSRQAFCQNVGTCRRNAKEKIQVGSPNKDPWTDVRHRDRATRSSDEGAVIALERRGSGILSCCAANRFAGGAA